NVIFSEKSLDVDIKLEKEDEGEYFEGFDIVVDIGELEEKIETDFDLEDEDVYNLEDILNNF
ncbi:MAG: hypothetical protein ACRC45_07560, partial [Cetobacterium sp.]